MAAYVFLAVLYALRGIRYPSEVMRDLRNPADSFGYFTIVAGTGVLAVGLLDTPFSNVSVVLVGVAALIWLVLGYAIPWFVWSVASQSLAVGLAAVESLVPQLSTLIGMLAVLSRRTSRRPIGCRWGRLRSR